MRYKMTVVVRYLFTLIRVEAPTVTAYASQLIYEHTPYSSVANRTSITHLCPSSTNQEFMSPSVRHKVPHSVAVILWRPCPYTHKQNILTISSATAHPSKRSRPSYSRPPSLRPSYARRLNVSPSTGFHYVRGSERIFALSFTSPAHDSKSVSCTESIFWNQIITVALNKVQRWFPHK